MKIIKSNVNLTETDFLKRLETYKAENEYNILTFIGCKPFRDNQIGIHCFINGRKVRMYYESGKRTVSGSLLPCKTWFVGSVYSQGGQTKLKGVTFFHPAIVLQYLVLLAGVVLSTNYGIYAAAIFTLVYSIGLVKHYKGTFGEQRAICKILKGLGNCPINSEYHSM